MPASPQAASSLARHGTEWWREGIVYQIYPRSYGDTNGDGVGDLPGIIEHLDHLGPEGLAIDAIWLSPIYPSPGFDVGYDVSDHAAVDPLLGTDDDFDRLVREAHARGLRVILDLVMNHTSDQHAWFQASRQSREGPYADYYLWRDPAGHDADGTPLPPNNWLSFFGGPAWQYEPARDQFYMHTFLVQQPEVNWRNPAVEAAQLKMVRGWLDRGVDGFRLDVFNIFLKDPEMPSNPETEGDSAWDRQVHKYDRDQPDFPALIARFRAIVDEVPGRMSVGELFYGGPETSAALTSQNHLVFDWELVRAPWSAREYRDLLDRRQAIFGETWPTVVLSNHDQSRHASRLSASAGIDDSDAVARAAAAIILTLRGTPFLYYGEEIGLRDVAVPFEEIIDPPARRVEEGWVWWNRDGCRSPMPWNGEPGHGFTTGRPWIRFGNDADTLNVAAQNTDPDSVLATYRRLIALRQGRSSLRRGSLRRLDLGDDDVLGYVREADGEATLVVADFATRATTVDVGPAGEGPWRPIGGSHPDPSGPDATGKLALRGLEVVILARG